MPSEIDKSLDALLPKIGGFGRYQGYVFALICVTCIFNAMVYLSFVFCARVINHRCKIEGCEESPTEFSPKWVKNAIPVNEKTGDLEKCEKYARIEEGSCDNETFFDKRKKEKCSKQDLVYADNAKTIMHEFDLQCTDENLWYLGLVGTINNVGQFVGIFSYGYCADRIGRKKMLVIGSVLSAIVGLGKLIYMNYYWFVTCEFLDAVVGRGSYICGYVIIVEMVAPKWRALAGNSLGAVYAVGQVLLAMTDWLVQEWKWLTVIVHVPQFVIISYLWIMPESIRWNLVRGRTEAAKKTIRKLAKVNKKELSEEELTAFDNIQVEAETLTNKGLLKTAFKSKILMIRMILYSYCWLSKNFLYYGLTLNAVYLTKHKYTDFSLTALVDIPAFFLVGYVAQKFGRKWIMFTSYMITAVSFTIFIILEEFFIDNRWTKLSLWCIGKFSASMTSGILYVWANELFPTYLRQAFMGTISSIGRIGGMIAPLHMALRQIWKHLPIICYAVVAGLAAFVTMVSFPETKNKKLPDTVEEAEQLSSAPVITK